MSNSEDLERKEKLLLHLWTLPPDVFCEEISLRLLEAYGLKEIVVNRKSAAGRGIVGEGVLELNSLVRLRVLFRVEQRRNEVPAYFVGELRRKLHVGIKGSKQLGVEKGIIITTGRFAQEAENAAIREVPTLFESAPTVELVDEDKLVDLCDKDRIRAASDRNAFVALCELASREKWCLKDPCTTCGMMHIRYGFAELVKGKHPDAIDWIVSDKNHNPSQITRILGYSLPDIWGWETNRQKVLSEIIAQASMREVSEFPNWYRYMGLGLSICYGAEKTSREITLTLVPQLLDLLTNLELTSTSSKTYEELSNLMQCETSILRGYHLEMIEEVLRPGTRVR